MQVSTMVKVLLIYLVAQKLADSYQRLSVFWVMITVYCSDNSVLDEVEKELASFGASSERANQINQHLTQ